MSHLIYKVETEREDDGRWIAEVPNMAGVLAYGTTEKQAIETVRVLALQVIAEKNQRTRELA